MSKWYSNRLCLPEIPIPPHLPPVEGIFFTLAALALDKSIKPSRKPWQWERVNRGVITPWQVPKMFPVRAAYMECFSRSYYSQSHKGFPLQGGMEFSLPASGWQSCSELLVSILSIPTKHGNTNSSFCVCKWWFYVSEMYVCLTQPVCGHSSFRASLRNSCQLIWFWSPVDCEGQIMGFSTKQSNWLEYATGRFAASLLNY